jgi:hypothetical protein
MGTEQGLNVDWQGEVKISEITLLQCQFAHHKSHLKSPGTEPGSARQKASAEAL